MALISRLPGGRSAAISRSTKTHTGQTACSANTENVAFEFTGSGKVNSLRLKPSTSRLGNDSYMKVIVDGAELNVSVNYDSSSYYLLRYVSGFLGMGETVPSASQPLDIEFREHFKVIVSPTASGVTIAYTVEISED